LEIGHLLPEGVLGASDGIAEVPDRFPDGPSEAGHLRRTEDEQGDRQEHQELELILEHRAPLQNSAAARCTSNSTPDMPCAGMFEAMRSGVERRRCRG